MTEFVIRFMRQVGTSSGQKGARLETVPVLYELTILEWSERLPSRLRFL